MRIRVFVVIVAAMLGVALTPKPAAAQAIKLDVPFQFTVLEKTAPAGSYEVEVQASGTVRMRSTTDPAMQFLMPVVTRLSPGAESKSKIVFDKVGTTATLSEVWFSGRDGYLVGMSKGAHTHQTVTAGGK